ncbi:Uncharacterized protein, contains PIN domain [Micrococcales bacterium KH10]|nr:Uncharacterized protein, contains PIN domain [Micrococcales bacterium KH10]
MIVDTSAIVALIQREPEAAAIDQVLRRTSRTRISAATLVELHIVIDSRTTPEQRRLIDSLLDAYGIEVVPFNTEHAEIARAAYRDFGRGSGHRAKLNLGDTYSYALASAEHDTLLYVGDDFTHTDLRSALDSEVAPDPQSRTKSP